MKRFFTNKGKKNKEFEEACIFTSVFIVGIIALAHHQVSEPWEQLKDKMKKEGENFLKDESVESSIASISGKAIFILEKGSKIYRARKIEKEEMSEDTRNLCGILEKVSAILETAGVNPKASECSAKLVALELCKQSGQNKCAHDSFWGFDAKRSASQA